MNVIITHAYNTRVRAICSSCCTFCNCFSLTILPLQLFPLSSLFLSFFFLKYEIYKHPPCNALFHNSEFLLYRTVSFNKNIITCYIFCSLFFFLSIFSSTLFLPLPLSFYYHNSPFYNIKVAEFFSLLLLKTSRIVAKRHIFKVSDLKFEKKREIRTNFISYNTLGIGREKCRISILCSSKIRIYFSILAKNFHISSLRN